MENYATKRGKATYIDLFAGCGGLSLGLYMAGWKGLFAVEKNEDAFSTLKYNLIDNKNHFDWPSWLPESNYEINEFIVKYEAKLKSLRGKVDLVAGGPPCQGFSLAGRRNAKDIRNQLVDSYIRFVKLIQPKVIFFENVKGFTYNFNPGSTSEKKYSEYVMTELQKAGYDVRDPQLVNVADLGLPQRRNRFILVGFKDGGMKPKFFFDKLYSNCEKFLKSKNLKKNNTLQDAISDLLKGNGIGICPDSKTFYAGLYGKIQSKYQDYLRQDIIANAQIPNSHRFPRHSEKMLNKFEHILKYSEKNKNITEEIKKKFNTRKRTTMLLDGGTVAPTITSLPDDYIHYSEPRVLTVRECARIQSFPDWYEFKGRYTTGGDRRKTDVPRYTQVGNAIPPLFAEQCGLVLKEMLDNE